jgi:hypothetical protein
LPFDGKGAEFCILVADLPECNVLRVGPPRLDFFHIIPDLHDNAFRRLAIKRGYCLCPSDYRLCWRWKSGARGGRPRIPSELRRLIREMSRANPLWGAPRIHGELLKLGIEVGQSTVAKYVS